MFVLTEYESFSGKNSSNNRTELQSKSESSKKILLALARNLIRNWGFKRHFKAILEKNYL